MASSPADRLALIYQAYKDAFARRGMDLKDARTPDDAQAVLANVDDLERAYLDAARQALDANGDAVEAAYQAAKSAADAVDKAYREGQALAARITAVAGVATAVSNLLAKAAGA
jgi:hypothetical protein